MESTVTGQMMTDALKPLSDTMISLVHQYEGLSKNVNTIPAAVQQQLQPQLDNIEAGTSGMQEELKRVSDNVELIGNRLKRPKMTSSEGD